MKAGKASSTCQLAARCGCEQWWSAASEAAVRAGHREGHYRPPPPHEYSWRHRQTGRRPRSTADSRRTPTRSRHPLLARHKFTTTTLYSCCASCSSSKSTWISRFLLGFLFHLCWKRIFPDKQQRFLDMSFLSATKSVKLLRTIQSSDRNHPLLTNHWTLEGSCTDPFMLTLQCKFSTAADNTCIKYSYSYTARLSLGLWTPGLQQQTIMNSKNV